MLTLENITLGVTCGLVAWVVVVLWMATPGGVLHWWYLFLDRKTVKGGFWAIVSKPLGLCEVCLGGQVALWAGLAEFWMQYQQAPGAALVGHFTAICVASLFAHLLTVLTTR